MERTRRKLLLRVTLAASVAAAGFALWGSGGPLPDPLVTQSDLPSLPDANDNGWTHIQALPRDLSLEPAEGFTSAFIAAQDEDRSVAERWEALVDAPEALRMPHSPAHVLALDAWSKAVRAPVFAYDCRSKPREGCNFFLYHLLHQLVMAESARLAVDGQWSAAKNQLASAIKADRELLDSSRNGIGAMVSSQALGDTLALAHLFESQHHGANARLRAELEAVAEYGVLEDFGVKNRIAAESYIANYKVLRTMEDRGVWASAAEGDWRPAMFYDAEHSAALLESAYLEFDSDTDKALGCNWLASLRNPIGCDDFDPDSQIALHETAFASIERDLGIARRWSRRIQDLADQR